MRVPRSRSFEGVFGRLFRNLQPFAPFSTDEKNEAFFEAVAKTMTDDPGTNSAGDNTTIPSGYTFFGQFIDHDITFDPTSSLSRQNDPDKLNNFRTPRFDLDSLYGSGPDISPYLYDRDGLHLTIGHAVNGECTGEDDLQRNTNDIAIIGDPRNDENVLVSQVHLMFIKFHNRIVDEVIDKLGYSESAIEDNRQKIFETAQCIARWHYQWVVINDFLKRITMPDVYDELIPNKGKPDESRLRFYKPHCKPFMPIEFSAAAYRFGHSMIRPAYTLNDLTPEAKHGQPRTIPLFDNQVGSSDPLALGLGSSRQLPSLWTLNWEYFLDIGAPTKTQHSRLIDTGLVPPLADLPESVVAPMTGAIRSLAERNLVRGWRMSLPSGQDVACAMGIKHNRILPQRKLDGKTKTDMPLWFYILEEAKKYGKGKTLGYVGSRIVAEVLIGLLFGDHMSYINQNKTWTPDMPDQLVTIPTEEPGKLTLADIVKFSGVPIDRTPIDDFAAKLPKDNG
ncbi:MAG: peroxidase [Anaerolineae bacterium]|nr:peroxidase [Anaerolineae bacterium]MCA9892036.1 peroxidase [Anaerolineae bacterium]